MSAPLALPEDFIRGTQLLRAGRFDAALGAFRTVYSAAQAADNVDLMAATLCEMAWSCHRLGDAEQGLECAIGAKWLWQRRGNQLETARAMSVAAMLYLELDFADEAQDCVSRALQAASMEDNESMLAFVLNAQGLVLLARQQPEPAVDLLEQAVAVAGRQANTAGSAYYLLNLGMCHAMLAEQASSRADHAEADRERAAAIEFSAAAIQHAQRGDDFWTLRLALGVNARALALQGNGEAALLVLDQWAELLDQPGLSQHLHYLLTLGDVQLHVGRLEEARQTIVDALGRAEAARRLDQQVSAAGKLAEILEAIGDAPAALAQFKRYHFLCLEQSAAAAQRRNRVAVLRANVMLRRNRDQAMQDQYAPPTVFSAGQRRA